MPSLPPITIHDCRLPKFSGIQSLPPTESFIRTIIKPSRGCISCTRSGSSTCCSCSALGLFVCLGQSTHEPGLAQLHTLQTSRLGHCRLLTIGSNFFVLVSTTENCIPKQQGTKAVTSHTPQVTSVILDTFTAINTCIVFKLLCSYHQSLEKINTNRLYLQRAHNAQNNLHQVYTYSPCKSNTNSLFSCPP